MELRDKYRKNVPPEFQDDYIYWGPSTLERLDVKEEAVDRDDLKQNKKQKIMQKVRMKKMRKKRGNIMAWMCIK